MPFTDQPRKDMYMRLEGKDYYIMDRAYKTQGRQGGLLTLKLRSVETGNNSTITIKAGVKVEVFEPETKSVQYLYNDGKSAYFMNSETFETVSLSFAMIGDYVPFLKEGDKTLVVEYEGKVLDVRRKPSVNLKVSEAADGVRGNTAGNPTKTVTLETGLKINVPLFVNEGDIVIVNTETGEYSGRVNS
ncbi:elongation factor P [bacterium]|nr:elongation factor P [bacterium]